MQFILDNIFLIVAAIGILVVAWPMPNARGFVLATIILGILGMGLYEYWHILSEIEEFTVVNSVVIIYFTICALAVLMPFIVPLVFIKIDRL